MFSTRQVPFRDGDYCARVANFYRCVFCRILYIACSCTFPSVPKSEPLPRHFDAPCNIFKVLKISSLLGGQPWCRALVRGAAAGGKWEDAIYWLQELINNQVGTHVTVTLCYVT
jgi:hypothetical protein